MSETPSVDLGISGELDGTRVVIHFRFGWKTVSALLGLILGAAGFFTHVSVRVAVIEEDLASIKADVAELRKRDARAEVRQPGGLASEPRF